jgi:3-hydroxymyristoyl/3-hydroxydecanoyl-(acyl carrier protein) dehydratase
MTLPFPNARLSPVAVRASEGSASFLLEADNPCFAGHFAQAPILPGVAHLALAVSARVACGHGGTLIEVRNVRLTQPVLPGELVDVRLTDIDAASVRFEILRNGDLTSSGVLLFDGTRREP